MVTPPIYEIVCNVTGQQFRCIAAPLVDTFVSQPDPLAEPNTVIVVIIAVLVVLGGFYALGLRKE